MSYITFDSDQSFDIFFNQLEYLPAKMHFLHELELYSNVSIGHEDITRCPRCSSDNVKVDKSQLRAGDEAGTALGVCNNCDTKFEPK